MTSSLKTFVPLPTHCRSLSLLGAALAGILVLGGCAAGPEASCPDAHRVQSPEEGSVAPIRAENAHRDDAAEKPRANTKTVRELVGTVTETTERQKRHVAAKTLTEAFPSAPDGMLFGATMGTLIPNDVRRKTGKIGGAGLRGGTHVRTALETERAIRFDEDFTFVYGQGRNADQMNRATRQAMWTTLDKITKRIQNKLPKRLLAEASSATPK